MCVLNAARRASFFFLLFARAIIVALDLVRTQHCSFIFALFALSYDEIEFVVVSYVISCALVGLIYYLRYTRIIF